MGGILGLIVEHHEVTYVEDAADGRIHGAGHGQRVGCGIGGGIDRGPEVGGQLIDVVEPQRDLVRADDPATPVLVSNSRLDCSVGCWRSLPRHSARPKPTRGQWRGSHLPFGAKLHRRMHANCPLSG